MVNELMNLTKQCSKNDFEYFMVYMAKFSSGNSVTSKKIVTSQNFLVAVTKFKTHFFVIIEKSFLRDMMYTTIVEPIIFLTPFHP